MRQRQGSDGVEWWAKRRILFVSGKGGVGKSLVAAALAQDAVQAGQRVLLAEIGETSYYKDFWGLPAVGHAPIHLAQGFDLALWSGESSLREYVLYYLRLERLYKLFFENKVMRALVNVAPGLSEIAILGKITSGLRKVGPPLEYDLVIVDSYATGHALALLRSPRGMMEAINFGPMGSHSRDIDRLIRDPEICGTFVVTLLEEMPVTESMEFIENLETSVGLAPESIALVANRLLPLPVGKADLKSIEAADPKGLGEFARYLEGVSDRQNMFIEQLRKTGRKIAQVPQIFSADPNELVRRSAEALKEWH